MNHPSQSSTKRRRLTPRLTLMAFLSLALFAASIFLSLQTPEIPVPIWLTVALPFPGLLMVVLGLLIQVNRPQNRLWLVCLSMGILFQIQWDSLAYVFYMIFRHGVLGPFEIFLAGLGSVLWLVLYVMIVLLTLLFPDGSFASERWRRVGRIVLAVSVFTVAMYAILPDPSSAVFDGTPFEGRIAYPFGLSWPFLVQYRDALELAATGVLVFAMLIAVVSIVARWRRANAEVRQQIKIVAAFIGLVFTLYPLVEIADTLGTGPVMEAIYYGGIIILFLGYPLAIGAAILFNHLFDIDLIIRRTVMYSAITALLAGVYFGTVTLLQSAFVSITGEGSPLAIVASTLAIAALFNPLRTRVQSFVDRRFNRRRYNAEQTLEAFAASLHDDVDMDHLTATLVDVVEETMQPESVGLWLAPSSASGHGNQGMTSS